MALSVHSGAFAANTGSATTSVTAPGFQPSVVIIFGGAFATDESNSPTANASQSYGFSNGTTHGCVAWAADDNVATTNCGTSYSETKVVSILTNGTPTVANAATLAMTANGFDLTWDSTPAAAYRLGYIALGGTDVTNVAVGFATMPTTVTTLDTNVGFVGDFGIFLSASMTAAGTAVHNKVSIGQAISSAKEAAMALTAQDGVSMTGTMNCEQWTRDDATLIGLTTNAAADFVADFTTFNQGGTNNTFRLNFSDAPPSAYKFAYCIIKGPQFDLGVSAAPAATTDQTVSGMAFQPTVLGIAMQLPTALNTIGPGNWLCLGAAVSTATEVAVGSAYSDATLNTLTRADARSTKCLATQTGSALADFTSFNSGGWTLTWTAGAGTAMLCPWWAAAGTGAGPPPGQPIMLRWGGVPGMNYTGRGNW